jgi:hypothetical protein
MPLQRAPAPPLAQPTSARSAANARTCQLAATGAKTGSADSSTNTASPHENRISAPHTSLTPLLTLLSVTSSIPREQRLARVVIGE